MEEISCILCGGRGSRVVITENGYNGNRCDTCNLIYISPRPNADVIENCYKDEEAERYADTQLGFDNVGKYLAAFTLSKIKKHRESGSILEIGSGGGHFILEAANWGYEPHAIEFNPIEARLINESLQIPCETKPISEKSFDGKRFDVIYHRDVLSHFHDPLSVYNRIHSALNDDGLLVFETGNIGDLPESSFHFFPKFYYPDHLFFFGVDSCKLLLAKTGFTLLGIWRYSILLPLFINKILWNLQAKLIDNHGKRSFTLKDPSHAMTIEYKRRLRIYYRYVSYFLTYRVGAAFPKRKDSPLKIIIFAEKNNRYKGTDRLK